MVTVAAGAIPRALRSLRDVRVWHLLGGLGGAMFIVAGAAGAVGAPEIGVALLSVALVCGQSAGSLAADGAGLSPAGGCGRRRARGVLLAVPKVFG